MMKSMTSLVFIFTCLIVSNVSCNSNEENRKQKKQIDNAKTADKNKPDKKTEPVKESPPAVKETAPVKIQRKTGNISENLPNLQILSIRDINIDLGDQEFAWDKLQGAIKGYDITKAPKKYLNKLVKVSGHLVNEGKVFKLFQNESDVLRDSPAPAGTIIFVQEGKKDILKTFYKKNKSREYCDSIAVVVTGYARIGKRDKINSGNYIEVIEVIGIIDIR